ncbi:MAG: hypothetical protein IKJ30_05905 [Bacilli bacterium]|nr:hypothetical protein [Bacilli bacterium]
MKAIILKIYRAVKTEIKDICNFFKLFRFLKEPSYYPERKRKNFFHRFVDNAVWLFKNHEINKFYNLYGLDIADSKYKSKEFLPYRKFMNERNSVNDYRECNSLRDKFVFYTLLNTVNIKTPKVHALIEKTKGSVNLLYGDLNKSGDYFLKCIDGECADGVHHLKRVDDIYLETIKDGTYILQERITQSEEISRINSHAINTLRSVTYRDNEGEIRVLLSVMRIGNLTSGHVDNWAAGGYCVPVSNQGILHKYGFQKIQWAKKTTIHEDSGFVFEGYQLEDYNKAIELAVKAHKLFKKVKFIGWDIAFTEDGPMLIEGNDNFEISLMQIDNPIKEKWQNIMKVKSS